jgi:hypothetical protein
MPGPGRLLVPEYKTCRSADLDALRRDIGAYGYHNQAAWNLAGIKALGLHGDEEPSLLFVCQEKDPPYLITVVELDEKALEIGQLQNSIAIHLYRECMDTGRWRGYSDAIEELRLPAWLENQYAQVMR